MSKFGFNGFELDIDHCTLTHAGDKIDIEPQVFCLLELLVTRHEQIVSREEILNVVWDGRIVSNGVIDGRIKSARAAIGDNGRDQRLIKTYPNRGYRFVGDLIELCPELAKASGHDATDHGEPEHEVRLNSASGWNRLSQWSAQLWVGGAALLLCAGVAIASATDVFTGDRSGTLGEVSGNNPSTDQSDVQSSKIAVLPLPNSAPDFDKAGLAPVINGEFRQAITAINGISVISISPETRVSRESSSPGELGARLGLTYVVDTNLVQQGNESHLDIELIEVASSKVLFSDRYTTSVNAGNSVQPEWPGLTAVSASIGIANALGLSINERSPYLVPYAFQQNVARANSLIAQDEYEGLNKAVTLLEQAIELEPEYLPAYQSLYHAYWRRLSFVGNEFENDAREMLNLTASMEWISPDAPETLIVKALTSIMSVRGTSKSASGEGVSYEWERLLNQAIKKDPNNTLARSMRAYLMQNEGNHSLSKIMDANEDALRFNPTDPTVLANFSRTLLCNGDVDRASQLARSNIAWNPDSRKALESVAKLANATGDYGTALSAMDEIIAKGWMQHDQTKTLRAIYFDLGAAERTLPHLRFAPARAQAYAMSGATAEALAEAAQIPAFYTSQNAQLIANPDTVPADYRVNPHYVEVTDTADGFSANPCSLYYLATDAFALRETNPARSSALVTLLERYYESKPASSLRTSQEFLGLMSLRTLQRRKDDALKVLDIAMDKGFVFVGRFNEPVLRQLKSNPEIRSRLAMMRSSSQRILREFDARNSSVN